MEIFNIGLGEMVFIFIIALIVFGPERLPEIGRQAGKMLREFRKMTSEVTDQVQRELQLVEEPLRDVRNVAAEASTQVQREVATITEPVREVRQTLSSAAQLPEASSPGTTEAPSPQRGPSEGESQESVAAAGPNGALDPSEPEQPRADSETDPSPPEPPERPAGS